MASSMEVELPTAAPAAEVGEVADADMDGSGEDESEDEGPFIRIPIKDQEETVEVFLSELPDNSDSILEILKNEFAPLKVWIQFAIEYYKQGKEAQCINILEEGATDEIEQVRARRGKRGGEAT